VTALSRQTEFTADMRDSRVDGCGESPKQTPEAAVEYGPEVEIPRAIIGGYARLGTDGCSRASAEGTPRASAMS
jgi:hypothetical protein